MWQCDSALEGHILPLGKVWTDWQCKVTERAVSCCPWQTEERQIPLMMEITDWGSHIHIHWCTPCSLYCVNRSLSAFQRWNMHDILQLRRKNVTSGIRLHIVSYNLFSEHEKIPCLKQAPYSSCAQVPLKFLSECNDIPGLFVVPREGGGRAVKVETVTVKGRQASRSC